MKDCVVVTKSYTCGSGLLSKYVNKRFRLLSTGLTSITHSLVVWWPTESKYGLHSCQI